MSDDTCVILSFVGGYVGGFLVGCAILCLVDRWWHRRGASTT